MRPGVWDAMAPYTDIEFGNSSGIHAVSRRAKNALEEARERIAAAIGAGTLETVFTSGGTESDNLALKGTVFSGSTRRGVVTVATEHEAVLETGDFLSRIGTPVTTVGVDGEGRVDPERLTAAMDDQTALVSVMLLNNETGVVQDLKSIVEAVKTRDPEVLVHTDAVQAFSSEAVDVSALGVDLMSLAAHKFGGPKGVGILYVREGTVLEPIQHGGGQELGRRSGTHDVGRAVGMAMAMDLALQDREDFRHRVSQIRDDFEKRLTAGIDGVVVNTPETGAFATPSQRAFPRCPQRDAAGPHGSGGRGGFGGLGLPVRGLGGLSRLGGNGVDPGPSPGERPFQLWLAEHHRGGGAGGRDRDRSGGPAAMRALVAMSGGVDSSVAAALMRDAGHEVVGVTLKMWSGPNGEAPTAGCCTVSDAEDARRVAGQLDIPYYVLDYTTEFRDGVVDRFISDYVSGRTPNPCIECNRTVKFDRLLRRLDDFESDVLVTGHHARIRRDDDHWSLHRGADRAKDQSYVLSMLTQRELSRARFPVGELTKAEVRSIAATMGLRTALKPESMDICFVGHRDYRAFLAKTAPGAFGSGPLVDTDGRELGAHDGIAGFTVGQRRGLGVAVGEPRFVVRIEPATSTVVLGRREELGIAGAELSQLVWTNGVGNGEIMAQYRAHGEPVPAVLDGDRLLFTNLQEALSPGQTVAFYQGDRVLGGALIARTFA